MAGETTINAGADAHEVGEVGLRERKKQQTRERIIEVAYDLFERNGYEETTIADIAAAADIAPRTFFSYFPSKEDVVFNDRDESIELVAGWLAERDAEHNTIDAIRKGLADYIARHELDYGEVERRHRIVAGCQELIDSKAGITSEMEEMLTAAVAEDLGEPVTALRPRVVASVIIAALKGTGEPVSDPSSIPEQLAEFDEVLIFLRGGLAAIQNGESAGPVGPAAAFGQ